MNELVSGVCLLIGFAALAYMAWRFFRLRDYKKSLVVILILALVVRIIGAKDPYLHSWDERYHALVAKNLIEHPLQPTLHEHTVLAYTNDNWVGGNVWVAKPSFPLWIMAGSIATFGDNLFAVRLPSVLLGLLAVWLTFLIGRRLFDERIGILAAFFHAINGLVVELIGGRVSSDHVELCFTVMVELAIYFLVVNLTEKPKLKNTFWAGVFMGLAFLSKWYPALIVVPVWLVFFITYAKFYWRGLLKNGIILLSGFLITALPWTWYMTMTYPSEMNAILFNALTAYSAAVESHDAPFYYYFHKIMVIYGELVYLALGFFIYRALQTEKGHAFWPLLTWALLPLMIFSLADTKRFTYMLIAAPAFFLMTAWFWFFLRENFLQSRLKWLTGLLMAAIIILPTIYMTDRVKLFGGEELVPVFYRMPESELDQLTSESIVFGTDDYVEIMFHTPVYAAYRQVPPTEKMDALVQEGFSVFLLKENHFVPYDPTE